MQLIVTGILDVLDHNEDIGKENKENIEEVNESFILMVVNLSILKNKGKNLLKNSINWTGALN